MRFKIKLAAAFIFLWMNLHGQCKMICFKDMDDSSAVSGVIVKMQPNLFKNEFLTDSSGCFLLPISVSDTLKYALKTFAHGYESKSVEIGTKKGGQTTVYLTVEAGKLQDVVITGQYKPVLASESMHLVKTIDEQTIARMGAVNLRDVLTNSNNIRLSQDQILGSSLAIQGLGGQNVKILIDGVPIIGRLNASVDLSQINLQNIEKIEIVEGPLAVQYGTDALAGTINLITKKHSKAGKQLQLKTHYESIGNYNVAVQSKINLKKTLLNFNIGRNYFDGWSQGDKQFNYINKTLADSARYQQWKPKEQYFAEMGLNYTRKKLNIIYKPTFFNESILNRGLPQSPYYENAFDDYYLTKRINNTFLIKTSWRKNWNFNLTAAYNYFERKKYSYYVDLTTLNKIKLASSSANDTSKFDLWMSRASWVQNNDSLKLNYELGYDINHESTYGNRIIGNTKAMGDYALYGTATYKTGNLVVKPGLRASYNSSYKAPLVPSFHVKYNLGKWQTIRASYAKGFRAPSLKELYFYFVDINHDIVGNVNLKAENSHNFSLSHTFNQNFKNHIINTSISVFYNKTINLISLALVAGTQYTYINIGDYQTKGLQASLSYKYKSLTVNSGFAHIGRHNGQLGQNNIPAFTYSPEINGSLEYQIKKANCTFALFGKYNGKMLSYQIVDEKVSESFIESYKLLDATVTKKLFNKKLSVAVGCKNIFNVTNLRSSMAGGVHSSTSTSTPISTGRNLFTSLTFDIL